jgi:hypothetical protein
MGPKRSVMVAKWSPQKPVPSASGTGSKLRTPVPYDSCSCCPHVAQTAPLAGEAAICAALHVV